MKILNLIDAPHTLVTLAEWHHQEWAYLNPGRTLQQRIAFMQSYLSEDLIPSTYIAETDHLLGSASIIDSDMETHPELSPWLASVFVAPEHRNNGIGGALVKHVMLQAAAAGVKTLYLFTPDRVNFYSKLGWQSFSIEQYRGHTVTLMQVTFE